MLIRFLIVTFLVLPISCHIVLSNLEKRMVFYPEKELKLMPSDFGLEYQELDISTEDGTKLNAWYIKANDDSDTVLFLHGNAGNIGDRIDKLKIFNELGLNVLIVDYRGYGKSGGRPSEAGLFSDALAAYQYLRKEMRIGEQNIIIYGVSLGGSVAVNCASYVNAKALVLENTFSSMRDMARHIFPGIPKFLVRNRFNSIERIDKVKYRKLFFTTFGDDVVPHALQIKLYEAASTPKTLVQLTGDHNSSWIKSLAKYKEAWRALN